MEWESVQSTINLPDELLSEIIFKYVPLCQWSKCLENVSKQFQSCVLIAYSRIKSVNFRKLFSVKHHMETRSKLYFPRDSTFSARLNNILMKLLIVSPNLTHLSGFQCIVRYVDFKTWNILKLFTRLQSICLDGVQLEPISFIPDLNVSFVHFAHFVSKCKSLKVLELYICKLNVGGTLDIGSFTSVTIHEVPPEKILLQNLSEKLIHLDIWSIECAFKSFLDAGHAMKMCSNLESLSVTIDTMNDYELLFNALPNFGKLIKLCVRSTGTWEIDFNFNAQFCVKLDKVKNQLQVVELIDIELSDEVQLFLLTDCLRLECLKFSGKNSLSATALNNISNLPAKLSQLSVWNTGEHIFPLLLPNLVKLSNFTDLTIGYAQVASSTELENICCLNNLQKLRLHGVCVNDALFENWDRKDNKMFERLVLLEIGICVVVTDIGACLLAKKAINLQHLELPNSKISDMTILALANVAKKLKTAVLVQIVSCLFDESAVLYLIKKATCLKKLEVEKELAKKVVKHIDFQPFLETVEVCSL